MKKMSWDLLLTTERLNAKTFKQDPEFDLRSEFQKDISRIIFSSPFRRLQDKTQVMPLPESDYVRTRLTHSFEVSSVAQSLGLLAGRFIIEKEKLDTNRFNEQMFSDILVAASLAHDIGNPPFGHSGEKAIAKYFLDLKPNHPFEDLSEWEKEDFCKYEGNASGFRILTNDFATGISNGLKLTYATLGAFSKYPNSSKKGILNEIGKITSNRQSQSKYGFFKEEALVFENVANKLGLISLTTLESENKSWCRHPLAFLLEAADSLTYHIIDFEDGSKLGFIEAEKAKSLLTKIVENSNDPQCQINDWTHLIKLEDQIGALRSKAIRALTHECLTAFKDNYDKIMIGIFDKELTEIIPSSNILKEIKNEHILENFIRHSSILEIELAGFKVVGNLIHELINSTTNTKDEYYKKLLLKIPTQYSRLIKSPDLSLYTKYLVCCDFVCRMTDGYAMSMYKKINGFN